MGNSKATNHEPISVSRRIAAPAHDIFTVLADPARHPDLDGSGMLRSGAANEVISGVGAIFVMNMHYQALGDYETSSHVVEFVLDRRIAREPAPRDRGPAAAANVAIGSRPGHRWIFDLAPDGPTATVVTEICDCTRAAEQVRETVHDGRSWVSSMTKTLERLDRLCTGV
jgi:hypothetical protein